METFSTSFGHKPEAPSSLSTELGLHVQQLKRQVMALQEELSKGAHFSLSIDFQNSFKSIMREMISLRQELSQVTGRHHLLQLEQRMELLQTQLGKFMHKYKGSTH